MDCYILTIPLRNIYVYANFRYANIYFRQPLYGEKVVSFDGKLTHITSC